MATTVRAECADCGIVRVAVDECTLVRIVGTTSTNTAFVCPMCTLRCVQTTRQDLALQLAAAGARLHDVARPDELDDPLRSDSIALLLDESWLQKLVEL